MENSNIHCLRLLYQIISLLPQPRSNKESNPLPNGTSNPILKLRKGEYLSAMCCIQLGSKFYFFSGKSIFWKHWLNLKLWKHKTHKSPWIVWDVWLMSGLDCHVPMLPPILGTSIRRLYGRGMLLWEGRFSL